MCQQEENVVLDRAADNIVHRIKDQLSVSFSNAHSGWKLSFFIAQMHRTAEDFCIVLAHFREWTSLEVWLTEVAQLRETAKLLRSFAYAMVKEYEEIEPGINREKNDVAEEIQPSINIQRDHTVERLQMETSAENQNETTQKTRQDFERALQNMEFSERVVREVTDDAWDLYEELQTMLSEVEDLVNSSTTDLDYASSKLQAIVSPWSYSWHAAYHLGDFEETLSRWYHAGFLGWSLILLDELSQKLYQQ